MKIQTFLFAILMLSAGGAGAAVLSHAPVASDEAVVSAGPSAAVRPQASELPFIEVGVIAPQRDLAIQSERVRLAMNGFLEDCEDLLGEAPGLRLAAVR